MEMVECNGKANKILDPVNLLSKVWEHVTLYTIQDSFHHAGLHINTSLELESEETKENLPLCEWVKQLLPSVSFVPEELQSFAVVDAGLTTAPKKSDENILKAAQVQEDEESEEGPTKEVGSPSTQQVLDAARLPSRLQMTLGQWKKFPVCRTRCKLYFGREEDCKLK